MRLAISNIAWDASEDRAVAALLQRYHIDAIDIAPSKYFQDPAAATAADIAQVKAWWSTQGITITGMQALLFGQPTLNMFGPASLQKTMLQYLDSICRIGAGLGATFLVFGSPKNRDRRDLDDCQTTHIAMDFFGQLGDIAQSYGVVICLEPNPVCYGANFMTTTPETAAIVAMLNHPAIRLQLDTGALCLNGEDPGEMIHQYHPLIGHIHASEPQLLPLGQGPTPHCAVMEALLRYMPDKTVSIEMRATDSNPIGAIEGALQQAIHYYRRLG